MNIRIEQQYRATYLLAECAPVDPADRYQLNMLFCNRIPGFIPFGIEGMDGTVIYRYEVTGLMPFSDYLEGKALSFDDLADLARQVLHFLSLCEDYLLDAPRLCFDPPCIYVAEGGQLRLMFTPSESRPLRPALLTLARHLLTEGILRDDAATLMLLKLIRLLQNEYSTEADLQEILLGEAAYMEQSHAPYTSASGSASAEGSSSGSPVRGGSLPGDGFWEDDLQKGRFRDGVPPENHHPKDPCREDSFRENASSEDSFQEDAFPDPDEAVSFPGDALLDREASAPKRPAHLTILLAAVPALLVYFFLRFQDLLHLTLEESVGTALLLAAAVLAVILLIDRFRGRSAKNKKR